MKLNDVELKSTFRSHIIYESIVGESFTPKGVKAILTFMYATMMASDSQCSMTFEDFIAYMDSNPTKLAEFVEWLEAQNRRQSELSPKSEPTKKQTTRQPAKKKRSLN